MIMQQTTTDSKPHADAYTLGRTDGMAGTYSPPDCMTDASNYDLYVRGWNDSWAASNQVSWWRRSEKSALPVMPEPTPCEPVDEPVFVNSATGSPTTLQVCRRAYPGGTRYTVARRYGPTTIVYEAKDYATEFAAYVAAADVAMQLGSPLDAPAQIKSRLIAYWYRRGRRMFYADEPRALCANKYERQGYDVAESEFLDPTHTYDAYEAEKDGKPGLTDCVTMALDSRTPGKRSKRTVVPA